MKIQVTESDLRNPYITTLNNPISQAIYRTTGQLWYVFDSASIRPMRSPLQSIALPRQVSRWWQQYQEHRDKDVRVVPPIEFELEIDEVGYTTQSSENEQRQ